MLLWPMTIAFHWPIHRKMIFDILTHHMDIYPRKSLELFRICYIFAATNPIISMFMATTATRNTAHPISYYWGLVKDMDNSQKLELVTMLIDSVKPVQTRSLIDAPREEAFPDMDKELYTAEEAYELSMNDIKAIYGK